MANLNLTYSGNMNITSAQLTSAGTIDVQYGPNTTGRISGWSYTPTGNLVCGETYTFYLYPQFSGTVLTENFTISGVDEAGIPRSDTAVLRQGFDTDFRNYSFLVSGFFYNMLVNSTAATENYLEVNATITGLDYGHNATILLVPSNGALLVAKWYVEDPTQPTGSVISSLEIVVPDSITGTGQASAVYVSSSATVSLVYSSTDTSIATIDPDTGGITVLQDGTVTFCVQDRLSGLVDCEQVNVYLDVPPGPDTGETGGTNEFIVFYNVTSTTQPTWIASTIGGENYPYQPVEGGVQNSTLISARLEDGTNVPLIEENYCIYYTFPETGVQKIYYTSSDSRIPGGAFAFRAGYTPGPSSLALFGVNTLNMTDIGWSAFFHMDNLTSLVMPNMNYIGDEVFLGHSLTGNLVLPNTLTHIGGGAFESGANSRLTSVTIPSSVTFIGGDGLDIAGLESMTFLGTNPPYLGYNQALGYTGYTFPIYVPCEAVYDYVSAFTQYAHRILCDGGGEPTTGITLSVADEIVESGVAVAIYPPDVFERYPEFLSSNPDVATIDNSGNITVISNGITTICVRDMVSGLSDCKTITARRAVYISSIELLTNWVYRSEQASVRYAPTNGDVSLVYSSSNPDVISVNSSGVMTVNHPGFADITVRDMYTNKSDTITVKGVTALTIDAVYNVTSTTVATKITNDSRFSSIISKIYLDDGTEIPKNTQNVYAATTYVFNNTGMTNVHFVIQVTDMNAIVYYWRYLPDLISIEYPRSVTRIVAPPLNCDALTTIVFPSTVTSLGNSSMSYPTIGSCPSLTSIYCYSQTAPTLNYYRNAFSDLGSNGTLYYPAGSDYSSWLNKLPSDWTGSPTL